jgi:alpha-L-rhamnosidase
VAVLAGALMLAVMEANPAGAAVGDPVAAGFRDVPREARLRMFWRIFGPAWTREEIDRQLEALQHAGVGGVMTCFTYPVALDDPARGIRNQPFLSPEFLDTLRYAAERARQLGLEFGVCGGTGWPFGGPSVTPRDAAQRLRAEMLKPLPDGTGYRLPALREGERIVAAFHGARDVTRAIHGDRLDASLSTEPCRVFIAGPTFMGVKRASLGAEGLVVDHFNAAAMRRYLDAVVAPMLRTAPDGLIRSLFCDSLELYRANWTHDFAAQFERRRGYDLIPRLPELFDDVSPAAPDLRFDFWRTAAELSEQRFARVVHAWCRRHGVAFALEPYGTPSMGFTGARYCDVPWGEQYEWKGFSFSRFAASGGHLAGKKVIGAEAWTWTGIPNRLADSLADLKRCSDLHFLSGENELTGVDFPYSPRSAGMPGWTPYYGPVMSPNNPQWLCFPDLAAYVNRCQWLLRQGEPAADVALYTPTEDAFANGPTEQMLLDFHLRDRLAVGELTDEFGLQKAMEHHSDVVHTLLTTGYNFDGIDFFAMNALARVRGARLVAGDGRYAIVVLPNLTGMDLAALEKLARFCLAGGTVIATRRLPDRVYGARSADATERLRARVAAMFGPAAPKGVTVHAYGKGRAIFTPDEREGLAAALAQAALGPDARLSPLQPDVSHVHRRVGERDFYFVVNAGATEARFTGAFRVGRKAVSRWDPMSGSITPLPYLAQDETHTSLSLLLPPYGSTFLCFGSVDGNGATDEDRRVAGSAHRAREGSGETTAIEEHPLDVLWRVTFDGPDAPPPYETRELTSWTGWPGGRFFSGRATCSARFEAPERSLPTAGGLRRCRLRFDQVREAAEVVINGHRAGSLWMPPYELDVTPFLEPGANTLQVTVANLPVNRVLGLPDPDLSGLIAAYGERFPPPEEKKLMPEPAPSGLIGQVLLLIEDRRVAPGDPPSTNP